MNFFLDSLFRIFWYAMLMYLELKAAISKESQFIQWFPFEKSEFRLKVAVSKYASKYLQ